MLLKYLAFLLLTAVSLNAQQGVLAFPGAEGWGMHTSGGRGATQILFVTNTNSSGAGSFRDAMMTTGRRIIIIKVNGWTSITSSMQLTSAHNDATVVGHLAPGQGFGIRAGANMGGNALIWTSANPPRNLIFRYLRFRLGTAGGASDNLLLGLVDGPGVTNIMVANCSFSWGGDENLSVQYARLTTIQDCLTAEDRESPYPERHVNVFGGLNSGQLSYIRNLCSHLYSRAPHIRGEVDVYNNVVYNSHHAVHSTDGSWTPRQFNVRGNYYVLGPAITNLYSSSIWLRQIHYTTSGGVQMHFEANEVQGYPSTLTDNTLMLSQTSATLNYSKFTGRGYVNEMTAQVAFAYATNNAGAILPTRDAVDIRLINEIRGTQALDSDTFHGYIRNESEVGGYPTLSSLGETPYTDTEGDGMEDSWEIEHFGNLNVLGHHDFDGDGWTNLEEFLWDTNPKVKDITTRDLLTYEAAPGQGGGGGGPTNPPVIFSGSRALIGKGVVQGQYKFKPRTQPE